MGFIKFSVSGQFYNDKLFSMCDFFMLVAVKCCTKEGRQDKSIHI